MTYLCGWISLRGGGTGCGSLGLPFGFLYLQYSPTSEGGFVSPHRTGYVLGLLKEGQGIYWGSNDVDGDRLGVADRI